MARHWMMTFDYFVESVCCGLVGTVGCGSLRGCRFDGDPLDWKSERR